MKKLIAGILIGVTLLTSTPVQAKVIMVPYDKVTQSYLKNHKGDTIYAYVQGKRIKKNGDGKDRQGYYINYGKGKIGQKYTTIFRFATHPKDVDDFDERIDIKGWHKPTAY